MSTECAKNCSFTLHYFNLRGRGELIRYMFVFSKTPYQDKRYSFEEWPKVKPTMPLGQLPVLECKSGNQTFFLTQSRAIIGHVARLTGLAGSTPEQMIRAHEAFEILMEVIDHGGKIIQEKDEGKKKQLIEQMKNEIAPRNFGFLEKRIVENGGKNMAGGEGYTYADLLAAQFFDGMMRKPMMPISDLTSKTPALMALVKAINESPEIKAYLATRPETDF